MPHPLPLRPLAAAALAAATLAACAAPEPPAALAPPAPRQEVATTAPADPDAAVRALAEGWWALHRRIRSGRAHVSEADRYLVEPYRGDVEEEQRALFGVSHVARLSDQSSLTVEEVRVDGDTAVVITCLVDADLVLAATTGAVVSARITASRRRDEAVRTPDGWRLAEHGTLATAEGTRCPELSPRR